VELALSETSSPLTIAQECLTQRENRTGVDKVRDDVELALIKVCRLTPRYFRSVDTTTFVWYRMGTPNLDETSHQKIINVSTSHVIVATEPR